MKVSVIIPTYNRRPLLERTLLSLAAQNFAASELELIVVDDGSTDDTRDFLRSFHSRFAFHWAEQKNAGSAAAQNRGVQAATGELLVFLDDDCICDPDLVAAHVEAHANAENLLVRGAVLIHPDTPRGTVYELRRRTTTEGVQSRISDGIGRAHMMLGANSSISRRAMLECPFDPAYKRIHDVEHGVRLWSRGYRPYFTARAVAYEVYSKSEESLLGDSYDEGKYEVRLTAQHPAFKPVATIAKMNEGGVLKRFFRRYLALHRNSVERFLRAARPVAKLLRFLPLFSRLAVRVLSARGAIAALRGAIEEAGSWDALEQVFAKRVPVLMYHNVGSPRPNEYPGMSVTPAEFERHIRYLTDRGFKTVLPSEWLAWRNEGGKLPSRPVMIVFDDAFAELCNNAFPVLERFGFGAACMVVTKYIGSTNRWDEENGRPSFTIMTEDQIREWSRRGIEFGGHTSHHPDLRQISTGEVYREVAECEEDLSKLLDKPPASFAYPFSSSSDAAREAVSKHFQIAFTTDPGLLLLSTDVYLVPRVQLSARESRIGMRFRLWVGCSVLQSCRMFCAKVVKTLISRSTRLQNHPRRVLP